MTKFQKPTKEMVSFFKKRTQEHINRVINYMKKLKDFPGLNDLEVAARARRHDEDKYKDPDLVLPYVWITEYYKVKNDGKEIKPDLQAQYDLASDASEKHVHRNLHHPEAHTTPEEMSLLDLAEMVADWSAMAEELGEGSAKGWADKNVGSKWKFTPEQTETIYTMIDWVDGKKKKTATTSLNQNLKTTYEGKGRYRDNNHITKKEEGTIPLIVAAQILGKKKEDRKWHWRGEERYFGNYPKEDWLAFVEDVKQRGILEPIFIVVEWVNDKPKAFIYEGNHRIKAAIEAGLDNVPVEVRYFGHTEEEFEWPRRHLGKLLTNKRQADTSKVIELSPFARRTHNYESADQVSDCQSAEIYLEELLYEFPFLEQLDTIHAAIKNEKGVDDGTCIELAEKADLLVHRAISTEKRKSKFSTAKLKLRKAGWNIKPSRSNPGYYAINIANQEALNQLTTVFPEMAQTTWLQEAVAESPVIESVKIDGYKDSDDHWVGWVTWEDPHGGLDIHIRRRWDLSKKEDWLEFEVRSKADGPSFEITKPITGKRTYRNINVRNEIAWVLRRYLDQLKGKEMKMVKGKKQHYTDEPYRIENVKLKVFNSARTEEEAHDEATILAENYPGYKFKIYKGPKLIGTVSWQKGQFNVTTAKMKKAMPEMDIIGRVIKDMLSLERGPAVWRAAENIIEDLFSWKDGDEYEGYATYIGAAETGGNFYYADVRDDSIEFYKNHNLIARVNPHGVDYPPSAYLAKIKLAQAFQVVDAYLPDGYSLGTYVTKDKNTLQDTIFEDIFQLLQIELSSDETPLYDKFFEVEAVGYNEADFEEVADWYLEKVEYNSTPYSYEALDRWLEKNGISMREVLNAMKEEGFYTLAPMGSSHLIQGKARRVAQPETVYVASIDWCDTFGDDAPLVEIYATSKDEIEARVRMVRSSIVEDEAEESGRDTEDIEDALCDNIEEFTWPELLKDYLAYSDEDFINDLKENLQLYDHFINWP